jgi:septum formation protein
MNPALILASTSPYRKALLAKLGHVFQTEAPKFDEEQHKSNNLAPLELAKFLARGKALSVATPHAGVIGSDQLIAIEGKILGKPKDFLNAKAQLQLMSGKTHELITAVAFHFQQKITEFHDITRIQLRTLTDQEIENYLKLDEPFDCAGSYKMEENGLRLVQKIDCQDFSAIQGLPLVLLHQTLRQNGWR